MEAVTGFKKQWTIKRAPLHVLLETRTFLFNFPQLLNGIIIFFLGLDKLKLQSRVLLFQGIQRTL